MAFVPRFTITSKLANQLMRIEAARQSVADLPITPAVLAPLRETARLFLGLTLMGLLLAPDLRAQQESDRCHVYLAGHGTENAKAFLKLIEEVADPQELAKRMAEFVQILGEFDTVVGEEQTTTKSFPIPGTAQFVTVTVFYTDESMAAKDVGSESMLLSLAIADKKLETAKGVPDCVQAEVSIDKFAGKIRVKKVTVLNRKEYLIGLECERKAPNPQ
jgi:hypothetical protein